MKRIFTLLFFTFLFSGSYAQTGCLQEWRNAFEKRGAYAVSDDMHRNVYVSFVEDGESSCVAGKARVENGHIVSVFVQYEDGTYELYLDGKIVNPQGKEVTVTNGVSDEIVTSEGEHIFIIFVQKLKPKKKEFKTVGGPGDL